MNAPAAPRFGYWMRWVVGLLAGAGLAVALALALGVLPGEVGEALRYHVLRPLRTAYKYILTTNQFAIAFGITMALQLLMPARPSERPFSVSLFQDFWWFFYEHVLHTLVVASYVVWLKGAWDAHLGALEFTVPNALPGWSRYVLVVLIVDLLYWTQHWLHHKVPMLWKLHRLHHSQRELNFFTDYRYHVLEYVVRHTVLVIPFLVLQIDAPTIIAFDYVRRWWTRFTHGNIRTSLGPLRYLMVTPQSHRVHHARDPEYRDRNFGAIFSFWDRLFGTQVPVYDVYPATGIDEPFPHEATYRFPIPLFVPLIQTFSCFLPARFRRGGAPSEDAARQATSALD